MRNNRTKKVFVGLSGGVDSSVAAYLLQKEGHDVTGVFIRSFNVDGCAERDAEDARRVAAHLEIPFYVFDFEEEYKKKVVEYMVNGYRIGLTPNPDVMCNKEIKFGLFLEKALEMGADYVATGHYIRLRRNDKFQISNLNLISNYKIKNSNIKLKFKTRNLKFSLWLAKDASKDQSYFLWTLTQKQLKHCLFPIGDYVKPEVREIARKAGLPTAEKKDSQGICFLGDVAIDEFLKEYIKPKKGPIVDMNGNKIGEHEGAQFYTIGQRHLGAKYQIPNTKFQKPFYVAEKNIDTNTIVVAEGDDNPALFRKEIEITDTHFINLEHSNILQSVGMSVMARVRYRQPLVKATLICTDKKRINTDTYRLVFDRPVKFVAPGQSAVFYESGWLAGLRGRTMLGGGIIV